MLLNTPDSPERRMKKRNMSSEKIVHEFLKTFDNLIVQPSLLLIAWCSSLTLKKKRKERERGKIEEFYKNTSSAS